MTEILSLSDCNLPGFHRRDQSSASRVLSVTQRSQSPWLSRLQVVRGRQFILEELSWSPWKAKKEQCQGKTSEILLCEAVLACPVLFTLQESQTTFWKSLNTCGVVDAVVFCVYPFLVGLTSLSSSWNLPMKKRTQRQSLHLSQSQITTSVQAEGPESESPTPGESLHSHLVPVICKIHIPLSSQPNFLITWESPELCHFEIFISTLTTTTFPHLTF